MNTITQTSINASDIHLLQRKVERERKAREMAEMILEQKSTELFNLNQRLKQETDRVAQVNRELTDSIRYAKRIQQAILPSKKLVKRQLTDSFILFKPKDIVSGDFYWMEQVGDSIIFAAADCTGHGVPGAFMSIIGHNGLNKAVNELGMDQPDEILNFLDIYLQITLNNNDHTNVRDGMDIAICKLDYKNLKLEYAGAFNPFYLIRDGELIEIKADRRSIGGNDSDEILKLFTNHQIDLQEGDAFYIFSDGFADQFGGEHGKKFRYKNFKNLLLDIQGNSMTTQRQLLDETIENWKGDLEQLDDIIVIGVQVPVENNDNK